MTKTTTAPKKKLLTTRPVRQDNPQKLTIHVGLERKQKAFAMAVARRCTVGRLFEDLVDAAAEGEAA